MQDWIDLPLDQPLFRNLSEQGTVRFQTAMENGFVNEVGGNTRFPGLELVADLGGNDPVFLHDWNEDLIAATSKGQVYRLDRSYNVENMTETPVSGGRRTIFAKTDKELLMAAGGPIVRLRATKTELLSPDAPLSTHVAWLDGYTIATEINSGRFYHSAAGDPTSWDPLDTFSADGTPDNINSMIVTPFRELLVGGTDSIEQFERVDSGDIPFFRRWSVGDGVALPYGMVFADNAVWTLNNLYEFIRLSGQVSMSESTQIGRLLESIDDWTDAWIGGYPDRPLHIIGQKFILLQAPNATNSYGTKGVTLAYDYRQQRWFEVFGWDEAAGVPTRWPGWSHWTLWGKVFVGGNGKIYRMTEDTHAIDGQIQRWLVRTSHIADGHEVQISDFRLMLRRGLGTNTTAPVISVRCSRGHRPMGNWVRRTLGRAGDVEPTIHFGSFGTATSFQFEIACGDDAPIDLVKAQVKIERIGA